MHTTRVLLGLTGLLAVLSIAATPAAANFQPLQPNTTQGPYQLAAGGSVVLGAPGSPNEIRCTEINKGEWHIQTKFTKIGVSPTKITQDPTKVGPHLQISGQLTKCTADGGLTAVSANASCSLQFEQTAMATVGTLSVVSRCTFLIPGASCTINLNAGSPDVSLGKVALSNIAEGQEDKDEITGVTSSVEGAGCGLLGFENTKANTLAARGIAHSQKIE